jgi:hypothetical protein
VAIKGQILIKWSAKSSDTALSHLIQFSKEWNQASWKERSFHWKHQGNYKGEMTYKGEGYVSNFRETLAGTVFAFNSMLLWEIDGWEKNT